MDLRHAKEFWNYILVRKRSSQVDFLTQAPLLGIMSELTHWWEQRKKELISIASKGPVCVYNGEVINDIVFDVLSLETVDAILHRIVLNSHPGVLEAMGRLGAHFVCSSEKELKALQSVPLIYDSATILFEHKNEFPGLPLQRKCIISIPVSFRPEYIKKVPDCFNGRDVLLCLPDPDDIKGNFGIAPMIESLSGVGARLSGAYLPWGEEISTDMLLEALQRLKVSLSRVDLIVLGRGLGVSFSANTGRVDLEATNETLLAVRQAVGNSNIWLEPGMNFLSPVGALLIPVEEIFKEGENNFIKGGSEVELHLQEAVSKGNIELFKLTDDPGQPVEKIIISGKEKTKDPDGLASAVMATTQPGDILLLPRFCLQRDLTGKGKSPIACISEHYLYARRICQVPI